MSPDSNGIYRSGYGFLRSRFLPGFRKINVTQCSVVSSLETHPVLVYESPGDSSHTIITFSGLSVHGYRDERLAAVSRAFARQGFRVVTPCVSDIDRLLVHPATIDKFAALIQAIHGDKYLNPTGQPLGIFAASYSGGIAMLAAVRAHIASCINSICLLGAFSHFSNVMRFVIEQDDADEYARYILLRNFLERSQYRDDEVIELLNVAILDNGFKRKKPELPGYLQSSSAATVDFFEQLLQHAAFRSELSCKAFAEIDRRENWTDHFDLVTKLDGIDFSVSLIHGRDDWVIPCSESIYLHEALQRLGKNSQLVLTKLLGHSNLMLSSGFISEVNRLASGFGFFIDSLRKNLFKVSIKGCSARQN